MYMHAVEKLGFCRVALVMQECPSHHSAILPPLKPFFTTQLSHVNSQTEILAIKLGRILKMVKWFMQNCQLKEISKRGIQALRREVETE